MIWAVWFRFIEYQKLATLPIGIVGNGDDCGGSTEIEHR